MKANKKLLVSAMALGLAGLTTVGSTYAWFSMNTTVKATGMQVNATTPASLAISNSATVGTDTVHNFTDGATTLTPITYKTNKYVTLTDEAKKHVNAGTGKLDEEKTEYYADVSAAKSGNTNYYKDYTVYIASSGSELANQQLSVKLYTSGAVSSDTKKAITVDFYFTSDLPVNRVGTLNFTDLGSDFYTKADVKLNNTAIKLPKAGEGSVKVIMRVYLDGALDGADGSKLYVRNDGVDISGLVFGAEFTTNTI